VNFLGWDSYRYILILVRMTNITDTSHDRHSTFEDILLLLLSRIATEIVFFRVRADSEKIIGHLNIIEHARL